MNAKRIVAGSALLGFVALNGYATYREGLSGFVELVRNAGPWDWVVFADTTIALAMVLTWMWDDARRRGRSPLGYALLTLVSGSIGPLFYYVTRRPRPEEAGARRPVEGLA